MEPQRIKLKQAHHHWPIYLMVIPTLILIALFQYYPAASGVFHSFYRWNGSDIAEPAGWANYLDLIRNTEFWNSFKVAFILGAWNIVKMIPALLVAVCIHRCRSTKMQFIYRALFVIPMVIPGLVVALIWRSFFFEATSGYLNMFLNASGLMGVLDQCAHWFGWGDMFAEGKSPAWLGDGRLILTACIVWGFPWVGSFAVLTHLAKLQGISKDVYEAADIDGVSWWSKFTRIELPLITGSIYILLVFVIIDTIKDAGMILALAGFEGGPGGAVTVPALFMLRKAFIDQRMGYACAVGIILTLVVMALQKLSTLGMNWSKLTPWQRRLLRLVMAGCGLALVQAERWPVLSFVLFMLSVPWPWLGKMGWKFLHRFAGKVTTQNTARGLARAEAFSQRAETTRYRLFQGVQACLLRFNKHLVIWVILAFAFLPLYLMFIVSLKTNQQFYQAPATITAPFHWENWAQAWEMITPTVANSVYISSMSTLLTLLCALCAAYFFARLRMPLSGFFWNAILVLMMMPAIANLVPLFRLLKDMNLLNTLTALILVGASSGQIFAIFVLRNFVSDIPQDLFEAADIDGANHFLQMRHVVLPLSGPILGTVAVMHFVSIWNDFVLPLIIIRDHARLPVMVQLLRMAGEYIKIWGPMMAGYALASIPIIILFIFSMKFFVKGMTEGAVKG